MSAEAGTLDEAWEAAEAALPEAAAWYMADDPEGDWSGAAWSITLSGPGDTGTYVAQAEDAAEAEMIPGCYGKGPTPLAALRELAVALAFARPPA